MLEHYAQCRHETTPRFLIARVVPQLAKSCRLHVDLPLLGVLTWLCAGARAPRRGVTTAELWRRVVAIFPHASRWTERERGAALRRIWKAGLATVEHAPDGKQLWRPCWSKRAMVCRLDVALWKRTDLSTAAKRVHALCAHRIAGGWSDAARWIGEQAGMSRARLGAALQELQAAGVLTRSGWIKSSGRRWPCWLVSGTGVTRGTGAQSEGVPIPRCARDPLELTAAPPPTVRLRSQYRTGAGDAAAVPASWLQAPASSLQAGTPARTTEPAISERVLAALAAPRPIAALLDVVRFGVPMGPITRNGRAGMQRMRQTAERILSARSTPATTVAAWLLEKHARGCPAERLRLALARTLGFGGGPCLDLVDFVHRTDAGRHLPTPRSAPRADQRRAAVLALLRDAQPSVQKAELEERSTARLLTVGRECATSGPQMARLQKMLDTLDAAWRGVSPEQRRTQQARYQQQRTWLLSRLPQPSPTTLPCTTSTPAWLLASSRGSASARLRSS